MKPTSTRQRRMLAVFVVISALALSVMSNTAVARGQSDGTEIEVGLHSCEPIQETRRFIEEDREWELDADGARLLLQCLEPGQSAVIVSGLPQGSGDYASSLSDPARGVEFIASGVVNDGEAAERGRCLVSAAGQFLAKVDHIGNTVHTIINGGQSHSGDEFVTVHHLREGTGEPLNLYAPAFDTVVTVDVFPGDGGEWSGVATFDYTAHDAADFSPYTADRWEGSPTYDATVIFLCGVPFEQD